MSDIDWKSIASAILEKRFQDIPDETWSQVAEKIVTKKRSKGRPPDCDLEREAKFVKGIFSSMNLLAGEMTWAERCIWVGECYDQYRKQGMKSEEAKNAIISFR